MFPSGCEVCSHSGMIMISRDIIKSGVFQNNLVFLYQILLEDQVVNSGVYSLEITLRKMSVSF